MKTNYDVVKQLRGVKTEVLKDMDYYRMADFKSEQQLTEITKAINDLADRGLTTGYVADACELGQDFYTYCAYSAINPAWLKNYYKSRQEGDENKDEAD